MKKQKVKVPYKNILLCSITHMSKFAYYSTNKLDIRTLKSREPDCPR